jgi:hypothetical protein
MELFFEKKHEGICKGYEGVQETKKAKEEI